MAHGSPQIIICHRCQHYKSIGRFEVLPLCECGEITEQTNKYEIKESYKLGIFQYRYPGMNWVKISDIGFMEELR